MVDTMELKPSFSIKTILLRGLLPMVVGFLIIAGEAMLTLADYNPDRVSGYVDLKGAAFAMAFVEVTRFFALVNGLLWPAFFLFIKKAKWRFVAAGVSLVFLTWLMFALVTPSGDGFHAIAVFLLFAILFWPVSLLILTLIPLGVYLNQKKEVGDAWVALGDISPRRAVAITLLIELAVVTMIFSTVISSAYLGYDFEIYFL